MYCRKYAESNINSKLKEREKRKKKKKKNISGGINTGKDSNRRIMIMYSDRYLPDIIVTYLLYDIVLYLTKRYDLIEYNKVLNKNL